jgi:hypothetical protein
MKDTGRLLAVQLYRGVGGGQLFTNVAVWESTGALRAAFHTPEFARHLQRYPAGTVAYPHHLTSGLTRPPAPDALLTARRTPGRSPSARRPRTGSTRQRAVPALRGLAVLRARTPVRRHGTDGVPHGRSRQVQRALEVRVPLRH